MNQGSESTTYIWLFAIGFPIFFTLVWIFVCSALSLSGGWATLSKTYREENPPGDYRWTWVSGRFRMFVNYNNCLKIHADEKGMHLSIMSLFKFNHPPLLIPWADVRVIKYGKYWFFWNELKLSLGERDQVPIALYGSVAEEFRTASQEYRSNQKYRYDPNPDTLSRP